MTTPSGPKIDALTVMQQARAQAAQQARVILAARNFVATAAVEVVDIICLAEWILDGSPPETEACTEDDVQCVDHDHHDPNEPKVVFQGGALSDRPEGCSCPSTTKHDAFYRACALWQGLEIHN